MRAFLFVIFALAACAQPVGGEVESAPPPEQGGSELVQQIQADLERLDRELAAEGVVAVSLNETADLGGGLNVRPLSVIEDSRCPANVDCVWAGRVVLRAEVNGQPTDITLDEPLTTPNGVVLLAVVKPSPWNEWPQAELPIPPYRFGFRRG